MADRRTVVPAPQSIAEVEEVNCPNTRTRIQLLIYTQLVKQLYKPGSPRIIFQIDEHLKRLQQSPEGWQVADSLLGSQDANVRFYAANTFTTKLNNDGSVKTLR